MKNIIYLIFILFLLSSCDSKDKKSDNRYNSQSNYFSGKNEIPYKAREIYLSYLKNKKSIASTI